MLHKDKTCKQLWPVHRRSHLKIVIRDHPSYLYQGVNFEKENFVVFADALLFRDKSKSMTLSLPQNFTFYESLTANIYFDFVFHLLAYIREWI